ncbi:hypothetical protein [Kitasatospora griseola]|uniref:hypothetical protein n=1 Tax=Kitasatospora griseola TaxID=2064 RepID=UPI0034132C04
MSIPGFTAEAATDRGSGRYWTGHGVPARGGTGVLPQARAGADIPPGVCVRLCRGDCQDVCRNPRTAQCHTCYSSCMGDCMGHTDGAGLI